MSNKKEDKLLTLEQSDHLRDLADYCGDIAPISLCPCVLPSGHKEIHECRHRGRWW